MTAADGIDLRCSAVVFRQQAVLLVHRTVDGSDDWVLPGGTPRHGETMVACARRELREETGLDAEPTRVALVLEAITPDTGLHTVDLVFAATEYGPARLPESREPGLEPVFVQIDALTELDMRPPIAGHLRSAWASRTRSAPYLGNLWRPKDQPALGSARERS
jgi:8-oxo-dGTP diphosphatase